MLGRALRGVFDSQLFTKHPLPAAPWTAKIHGYEFFGATERWVHSGFAPLGAMECRYLIEGEITTIGIDPQRVDGERLKDCLV